jgi:hypothetical protein
MEGCLAENEADAIEVRLTADDSVEGDRDLALVAS